MKNLESPAGLRAAWAARRKELTPKTIRMSHEEMVKVGSLPGGGLLPPTGAGRHGAARRQDRSRRAGGGEPVPAVPEL